MLSWDEENSYVNLYDPENNQFKIILSSRKYHQPGCITLLKNQFVFSVQCFTATSQILDLSSETLSWIPMGRTKSNDFGLAELNDCAYVVSYTNILIIYIYNIYTEKPPYNGLSIKRNSPYNRK